MQQGFALEREVERILERMQEEGLITSFERHRRFSHEDRDGNDFTVTKAIGEAMRSKSFGVTISQKRKNYSQFLHMETVQFCFPAGPSTKPETIRRKVLELFS